MAWNILEKRKEAMTMRNSVISDHSHAGVLENQHLQRKNLYVPENECLPHNRNIYFIEEGIGSIKSV